MPPSTKRSQRTRRETINNVDIPDSSPSRPAKRRKKVDEPVEKPAPEPVKLPVDQSGIAMDDDELITAVASSLAVPAHFVQATQDHANTLHEKHSKEGVQAYAKLAGKDWTFYVKKLNNVIGRPPEGANALAAQKVSPHPNGAGPAQAEDEDDTAIHIDLGPHKMVSRLHAEILFDSDTVQWNIKVNGRNGIRINNETVRKGDVRTLSSGQVIEIGGVEMMFVLPHNDATLEIHPRYLQRAGLIQMDDEKLTEAESGGFASSGVPSSQGPARGLHGVPGALPIAPAPPDYRRPGTPVSARSKALCTSGKSPGYASGAIFMDTADVDLSLESNKHIKPSYSYAQMISQAILDAEDEKLNLNGIYNYIMDKYAYYRFQLGGGWQNSIRHNLSLNKSFVKVARSTDEPGKGMKWCITLESRDEMIRNRGKGGRGGHRGSSLPGSPANFVPRASKDAGILSSAVKSKRSPRSRSPPLSSYPSNAPQFTPDRRGQLSGTLHDAPGDGSPLPPHRRPRSNFGLSDNNPGSPVLSSSYMQEENTSFVTPAPHRVHPRLAPPSTAQRPSQVMPTSSPAPFWKFVELGNTPMKSSAAFDSSPTKGSHAGIAPSSSPPPVRRSSAASPTRNGLSRQQEVTSVDDIEEEDQGIDLTRGFQSIGSYHAPASNGVPVPSALNGHP